MVVQLDIPDYMNPLSMCKPIVLDLFCGAGGMSLGFQMAGYSIGLGIDKDSLACHTHAYNFGLGHTVCADIKEIADPEVFLREHGIERVDVIIGGPPCQGFSRVGRGKLRKVNNDPDYLHDPRNQLYREFIRFVVSLKPAYFVIENVPDMQYYRNNGVLLVDAIKNDLESCAGYIVDSHVLLAADFGVPQLRQRLFVIGNRLGKPIVWPTPTHRRDPYISVWEAISDLPVVGIQQREDELPYSPRQELNEYQRQMRAGSDGVLYNHQTRWHNPDDLKAFCLLQEGGRYIDLPDEFRRYDSKRHPEKRNEWFRDRYRKLIRTEPSWTVEAHIGKDTYRHIYPSRDGEPEPPRTISVREAARLQSFPDRFRFLGAFTRQFHQVGNAVPPLLAKAVAETILPDVQIGMAVGENALLRTTREESGLAAEASVG
jgi:DNA (cytosine-5)-methyltransferase 1